MRKGNRIFKELTEAPPVVPTLFGEDGLPVAKPNGRDKDLIAKRNRRLAARVYYYRIFYKDYSPEWIKARLVDEFELSEVTITELLFSIEVLIRKVFNARPSKRDLKKEWEWMDWK